MTGAPLGLLAIGLAACASSVIFIKLSQLDPILLCAVRLGVAVAVLSPLLAADLRRQSVSGTGAPTGALLRSLIPGAVLGLHFISWVMGARMTSAVNATLIVNLVPAATPLLLWGLARERVLPRELLGTGVALAGVGLLGASDWSLDRDLLLGDAVCLGSMLLFALYLVLARRNRDVPGLWLYVVPLYATAGALCTATSFALESPLAAPWSLREVVLALCLGLVPTVIGHSILNRSMQVLRGQVVGVANLSQPLLAGLMAYLFLGEIPGLASYAAGALVALGVALAIWGASSEPASRSAPLDSEGSAEAPAPGASVSDPPRP